MTNEHWKTELAAVSVDELLHLHRTRTYLGEPLLIIPALTRSVDSSFPHFLLKAARPLAQPALP